MVGLFSVDGGLFYGGGLHKLGVQSLGVVTVGAFVAVAMLIIFTIIKKTIGLRVSTAEEIAGLDIEEHSLVSSYTDFMPAIVQGTTLSDRNESVTPVSMDMSVPVIHKSLASANTKTNQGRLR